MKIAAIFGINILIVSMIVLRVISIDDDKAHLIFLFYYPSLIIVNFVIGLILKFMDKEMYKNYWRVCLGQLLLFVPIYAMLIFW
jgi:hypothetical protein